MGTGQGRLTIILLLTGCAAFAQRSDSLITNRAMNIFLSEAAGYYLSHPDNMTLYKNSVVVDAADGNLSLYHNFREAPPGDIRVKGFMSIGASADIANAYASAARGKVYNNRFGILVKQTWLSAARITATPAQRSVMAALNAGIRHALDREMDQARAGFDSSLAQWPPDEDQPGAKDIARRQFAQDQQATYDFEWAHRQAERLATSFNYQVIAVNWTSARIYIPLVTENFSVTGADPFADPARRHAYPVQANLTHTRLWEGSHFGRLLMTLAGDLTLNNSRDAHLMAETAAETGIYAGSYSQFLTPVARYQLVWLPTISHFGVSGLIEQYFGDFHVLNARLGFPIVLINKKAEPALNFEFQIRFFDLGRQFGSGANTSAGIPGKTSIGLTMGVPFSKIAF